MLTENDAEIGNDTIQLALQFVDLAANRIGPPDKVERGYYPTIEFSWTKLSVEFEIHQTAIEFYRFMEGRTEISEYRCVAGTALSDELTVKLESLKTIFS